MNYKAVIFDLDGTLLYTLDDLADGVNIALSLCHMPTHTTDEVRMAVGNGVVLLMERMVPDGKNNPRFAECLDTFRREYAKIAENKTAPYPGILPMLDKLAENGVQMAVVSNKFHDATVALVKRYFPQIPVSAGERESEGIRKKPAPDTVFQVLREMGVSAADAVYVGDSDVDVETARNAGMDCISVTWGFRDLDFLITHGATVFAHTPGELLKRIL